MVATTLTAAVLYLGAPLLVLSAWGERTTARIADSHQVIVDNGSSHGVHHGTVYTWYQLVDDDGTPIPGMLAHDQEIFASPGNPIEVVFDPAGMVDPVLASRLGWTTTYRVTSGVLLLGTVLLACVVVRPRRAAPGARAGHPHPVTPGS